MVTRLVSAASPKTQISVTAALNQLPLAFFPQRGQSETAAQFEAYGQGSKLSFAPQAIRLRKRFLKEHERKRHSRNS